MTGTLSLVKLAGSRINRSVGQIRRFAVYLKEVQLLSFSRDLRKTTIELLVKWGVPARLAVEIKRLSDLHHFEQSLRQLARVWKSKTERKSLLRRNSEDYEWDVASSDLSAADFLNSDEEISQFQDWASLKIRTRLKRFLHYWKLKKSDRLDIECEIANKLQVIGRALSVDPATVNSWFLVIVKSHWIRSIDDGKLIPESIWNEWSSIGLVPFKVILALRTYPIWTVPDPRQPCLPAPTRRRSSALPSTKTVITTKSNISIATTASEPPSFMSSLRTLQSKLLEFTQGRVKTKHTPRLEEDDPEQLASKFISRMDVFIAGKWLPACKVKLVKSSRMRWSLSWWSIGREQEPPLGHISILSIAKVAKAEERTFTVKFRSLSVLEEIKMRCESEEEQVRAAKMLRNLIRISRKKLKT